MSEAAVEVADPFAAAATVLAAREAAVNAEPESPAAAGAEATEGDGGAPATESPAGAANEVTGQDGADEGADVSTLLRAAIERDPALANDPGIRARVGLAPLPVTEAPEPTPKAVVFKGVPSEEEILAGYDSAMGKGKDFEAVRTVSRADAEAAYQRALRDIPGLAVKAVLSLARDGKIVEEFVTNHPEFKGREREAFGRVQALKKSTDFDALSDVQIHGLLDPRPSKSVAEAAAAALQRAGAVKKAVAASAAAAPTNQRPAGAPASSAQKPQTALDRAQAQFLKPTDDRKARSFYPDEALKSRSK